MESKRKRGKGGPPSERRVFHQDLDDSANLDDSGSNFLNSTKNKRRFTVNSAVSKQINANNSRGILLRSGKAMPEAINIINSCRISSDLDRDQEETVAMDAMDGDRIITTVDHQEDEEFPAEEEYDSDEERQQVPAKKVYQQVETEQCASEDTSSIMGNELEVNSQLSNSPDIEISFKPRQVDDIGHKFENLKGDPAFESFIKKLVAKEVRDSATKSATGKRSKGATGSQSHRSPLEALDKSAGATPKNKGMMQHHDKVKSPSDTTIYAPGLARLNQQSSAADRIVDNLLGNPDIQPEVAVVRLDANNDMNQQIEDFIEGVRVQSTVSSVNNRGQGQAQPGTSGLGDQAAGSHEDLVETAAKQRASQLILDAERYKASINTPPGMLLNDTPEQIGMKDCCVLDDDEFFHVSCHIDESLRVKIEGGQFVDLERLLPKNRQGSSSVDDTEMKLVFREGRSFFVPVFNQNRINSVRRWEQAFRIYAAIYSQANPSRAAEIWQYVHVINVAAGTYIWENVSNYDITFRHLMAQNPKRSWSKIYNQMWNLSMRHVIQRQFSSNAGTSAQENYSRKSHGSNFPSSSTNSNNNSNSGKKPKYCWGFNRGHCKDGPKCKYVDRCSYCDKPDHGKNTCQKIGAT